MAYYSGSANSMSDVRAALVAACVGEGWAWNSSTEMLSKGLVFVRLQVVSGYLTLLGRTSADAGDAPGIVRMGQLGSVEVAWPVEYSIFIFESEVYCVVRFSVDFFLWCAFGQSTVQGLPGSGMWVAASVKSLSNTAADISPTGGAQSSTTFNCPAIFWRTSGAASANADSWVHSDLDGQGWWPGPALTTNPTGIKSSIPLIGLLPNNWNSEAVLLPIREYKVRASNKLSLTVDLAHARYTRVDNYSPGQIIDIGADRWIIFPFYRKNTDARDGGGLVDHTGTFGWAIRYEGP